MGAPIHGSTIMTRLLHAAPLLLSLIALPGMGCSAGDPGRGAEDEAQGGDGGEALGGRSGRGTGGRGGGGAGGARAGGSGGGPASGGAAGTPVLEDAGVGEGGAPAQDDAAAPVDTGAAPDDPDEPPPCQHTVAVSGAAALGPALAAAKPGDCLDVADG